MVQYSAGGGTDLSVRGVLDGVKDVPVNFSVSNVTGNGGLIGLTQVANSKADGYTLGVVNTDFIINMVLGQHRHDPGYLLSPGLRSAGPLRADHRQ